MYVQREGQAVRRTGRQADGQSDGQAGKQAVRQAGSQAVRQGLGGCIAKASRGAGWGLGRAFAFLGGGGLSWRLGLGLL